jgi:transcriptional regulator with XRE-family HTH domain
MRHRLIARRLELDPPLSREALAHRVGIHPKTLGRIERGESTPRPGTRARLADELGWTAADLALALADDDPDAPLGPAYRAPTTGLDMLAMLEQSCHQLRTLELTICPGLLQVPSYAAAIESLPLDAATPDKVERRVAERLMRQRALDKDDPLHLFALLDPSILRREVGGPSVLAEQVEHLHEMNRRPNITIRLLSDAGGIAASSGPFKLLTGDDPEPFMVVTEDVSSGLSYRGGRSVVGVHNDLWDQIWSVSDALA